MNTFARLVLLACLSWLPLAAIAKGNGQGHGQGHGPSQANAQGHGQGAGSGAHEAHGNSNGSGHGQGHGRDDGDGNDGNDGNDHGRDDEGDQGENDQGENDQGEDEDEGDNPQANRGGGRHSGSGDNTGPARDLGGEPHYHVPFQPNPDHPVIGGNDYYGKNGHAQGALHANQRAVDAVCSHPNAAAHSALGVRCGVIVSRDPRTGGHVYSQPGLETSPPITDTPPTLPQPAPIPGSGPGPHPDETGPIRSPIVSRPIQLAGTPSPEPRSRWTLRKLGLDPDLDFRDGARR
jgi:hypothetical protein